MFFLYRSVKYLENTNNKSNQINEMLFTELFQIYFSEQHFAINHTDNAIIHFFKTEFSVYLILAHFAELEKCGMLCIWV